MKLKSIFLILILLGIISSCVNDRNASNNQIEIEERVLLPDNDLTELFEKIRPNSQIFKIHADSTNLIECKSGTKIYLPENCFVDSTGNTVTDIVEIEIVEVLSKADFIKTNLQTISDGNPIVSEGMIFIDVKSKGMPVTIKSGKELQIEVPKKSYNLTPVITKIFNGSYDTLGNINWELIGLPENKMIYLPLELFDYKYWTQFGFKRPKSGSGYMAPFDDEIVDSTTLKNPKFEKTFIATREFEERLNYINAAEWNIGHYYSFYSTTVEVGQMIKDSTILNIYMDNVDKDLWFCDSLAYAYMLSLSDKIDFYGYHFSEAEQDDLLAAFKKFYEQRLTTVIQIDYTGLDLNSSEAKKKLLDKGLSDLEVDEVLGAFTRQKKIIQERKDNENLWNLTTNSFKIAKLGWINCDYFYNDPTAKEVKILASIDNISINQPVSISLVLDDINMVLTGIRVSDNLYSFTGIKEPYTRLPIGKKATIIVLSYLNNEIFFGLSRIKISEKEQTAITIKETDIKEINEKLKAL